MHAPCFRPTRELSISARTQCSLTFTEAATVSNSLSQCPLGKLLTARQMPPPGSHLGYDTCFPFQSLTAGTCWVSSIGLGFTQSNACSSRPSLKYQLLKKPGAKHYACISLQHLSEHHTPRRPSTNGWQWMSWSFQRGETHFSKCSKFFLINFNGNLSLEYYNYFCPLRVSPVDLKS